MPSKVGTSFGKKKSRAITLFLCFLAEKRIRAKNHEPISQDRL